MNIKFCYLYRDGANYKQFNEVVFANPQSLGIIEIKKTILGNLIDGTWFVCKDWKLRELHFKDFEWDDGIDHEWHEFEDVLETIDEITGVNSVDEFLTLIKKINQLTVRQSEQTNYFRP